MVIMLKSETLLTSRMVLEKRFGRDGRCEMKERLSIEASRQQSLLFILSPTELRIILILQYRRHSR